MNTVARHESMRGYFVYYLHGYMAQNKDIYVLTGDLGYAMFDYIKRDYPDRFINCGASEHSMMAIAVGLAQSGKKVFVYSITSFLIYRAFEVIRTYINHEKIPLIMVGSGRDTDYAHDGWSHHATDVRDVLDTQRNILQLYPNDKSQIEGILDAVINNTHPYFISLRR